MGRMNLSVLPDCLMKGALERRNTCLCAMLLVLGAAGTAWGAGSKEATQQRATQARKACLSGDYQKGVDILSELFIETKDPVSIFNQGRCFEQSSRYEEAISRFEEYLRVTKNTKVKDRDDAQEHIAECQAKLDRARAIVPVATPAEPTPENPQPAMATPESPPEILQAQTPQAEPASSGRGLRIAGIVVASVGVAALGTAVFLNVQANSMAKDLETPRGYERSKANDRKTYETLGWVGYGVGAACLVGGAVLYGLGLSNGSSPVALIPTVAPSHAGLSLQGAF